MSGEYKAGDASVKYYLLMQCSTSTLLEPVGPIACQFFSFLFLFLFLSIPLKDLHLHCFPVPLEESRYLKVFGGSYLLGQRVLVYPAISSTSTLN